MLSLLISTLVKFRERILTLFQFFPIPKIRLGRYQNDRLAFLSNQPDTIIDYLFLQVIIPLKMDIKLVWFDINILRLKKYFHFVGTNVFPWYSYMAWTKTLHFEDYPSSRFLTLLCVLCVEGSLNRLIIYCFHALFLLCLGSLL